MGTADSYRQPHCERSDCRPARDRGFSMKNAIAMIFVVGSAITACPAFAEQMIQFFSGKSLSAFCEKSVDE
jgi:hypothetical protein